MPPRAVLLLKFSSFWLAWARRASDDRQAFRRQSIQAWMTEAAEADRREEHLRAGRQGRITANSADRGGQETVERDAMEERPVVRMDRGLDKVVERRTDHANA